MKHLLFGKEMEMIQSLYPDLFLESQRQFIQIIKPDDVHELVFMKGHSLPQAIIEEIKLSFKYLFEKI